MEVDLFGSRDGVMSSNSNSRLSKNNTTSITNIIYISLHIFCFFFMNFASKSAEAFETTAVLRFFAEA